MTTPAEEPTVNIDDTVSRNMSDTHFDIAIIGSGPAGYTASIYTSRAKLKTIIISGSLPGGQLMTTTEVENFPGFPKGITGPELMMNMQQQSERFGTRIVIDEVTRVDFKNRPFKIFTGSAEYTAESVLISTGASPRKLGLKSESDFSGKGVSYCATCDGPFFRDQEIVVVGGGGHCTGGSNLFDEIRQNSKNCSPKK